ncbi:uncharacterized protein LOC110451734 [Mizuhopecten yessoensis]|uniref:Uncharacterized protein n=1 Tax=Mizuhopecten yessoensis TaxID=6573 RepID=A0A210QLC2_MIZYE|nr:uncharacterized protein LOC110451734 [Mizuhopecten yessoensis]OWF49542.1 hypothetical protein KP79_PYT17474 [Mizuhopecten yessoensis]
MKGLLILAALVGVSYGQMKCLFCESAADITDCQTTVDCGSNERCFLEKVTTKNLNFVYNAGCRSAAVCSIMDSLAGASGRKRDLVNCAKCCDTTNPNDPCNMRLCGAAVNVTTPESCVVCDRLVSGASSCSERQVCQDTEICKSAIHIVGGLIRYEFGCESTYLCEAFLNNDQKTTPAPAGRRSTIEHEGVTICSSCCRGKDCNREDCYLTHTKMTAENIRGTTTPAPSG